MEPGTVGAAVLHEPSSAFDPDREMKDRKLTQIFKKLHMEQDLNTLLDLDDTVPRPSKVALNHMEETNKGKAERCRPRKILDYAVLAKGQGYRNSLVGSFASRETDDSGKSEAGYKRIRFKKNRFEDGVPTLNIKRRGRYASGLKKNSGSGRFSYSLGTGVVRKKESSRPQSFASGTKGGILKRHVKDAENIKQAFLISKEVLNAQKQQFEEFVLPEKWIKESQKRKKVDKVKSKREGGSSSVSVEDLAMERLVRAFKTAKLLYPEKFAEYFPDFIHCFESEDKGRQSNENDVVSKQMYLKSIKSEEDALTFDKNFASNSGEDQPKRNRKVPKVLREYSTDAGVTKKKLISSQKISRINGPLAGTSGLRKRSKTSDSQSNQSAHCKSQQNGKAQNTKDTGDAGQTDSAPTSKRRKCAKGVFRLNAPAKSTDVDAVVSQSNIEDSAEESSSDESGNMRSSKRQRAQSGFYKTMLTLYDKKRS